MNIDLIINKLLEDINVLEGKKKDLIIKAAEDLEKAGMEPAKICLKLSEVLEGKTSAAYIREILPEKYKQKEKARTPPTKVLTDSTQETEKEVVNLKEQKDVKIGHNEEPSEDTINNFDDSKPQDTSNYLETKQETPQTSIEEQLIIEKQDKQIRDLVNKIIELRKQLKEKDIEIHTLKGQLVMQSPYNDINRMAKRLK